MAQRTTQTPVATIGRTLALTATALLATACLPVVLGGTPRSVDASDHIESCVIGPPSDNSLAGLTWFATVRNSVDDHQTYSGVARFFDAGGIEIIEQQDMYQVVFIDAVRPGETASRLFAHAPVDATMCTIDGLERWATMNLLVNDADRCTITGQQDWGNLLFELSLAAPTDADPDSDLDHETFALLAFVDADGERRALAREPLTRDYEGIPATTNDPTVVRCEVIGRQIDRHR
ncbi:MAG: hypothetical protein AAF467_21475 [Actinomycetota bacterium]